jgi:hypothetical protein
MRLEMLFLRLISGLVKSAKRDEDYFYDLI